MLFNYLNFLMWSKMNLNSTNITFFKLNKSSLNLINLLIIKFNSYSFLNFFLFIIINNYKFTKKINIDNIYLSLWNKKINLFSLKTFKNKFFTFFKITHFFNFYKNQNYLLIYSTASHFLKKNNKILIIKNFLKIFNVIHYLKYLNFLILLNLNIVKYFYFVNKKIFQNLFFYFKIKNVLYMKKLTINNKNILNANNYVI